jgi:hypothetical protein
VRVGGCLTSRSLPGGRLWRQLASRVWIKALYASTCAQQRKEAPYTRDESAYGGHYRSLCVLEGVVEERYHPILNLPRNLPSLYNFRAGVIITHTPSTSDACETHTRPTEKSITIQPFGSANKKTSVNSRRLERQRAPWQRGQ